MKKIILVILTFSLVSIISFVRAADEKKSGEGLTISPPLKELTIKPGEESKQKITITNPTKNLIEVYPSAMNFKAGGENGEPAFTEPTKEEENFALANWLQFSEAKIALTPEQVFEFEYSISAPDGAEPGGHYGAIFFAKEPQDKSETAVSNQVLVSGKIGALIMVKVPGAIVEKGTLDKLSTHKIIFNRPVNFETKITNLGNVHFKPKGEIIIKNLIGGETGRAQVNEAGGNVLPDSSRRFNAKWDNSFWSFGRYVAEAKLIYGESDKELTGQYAFYLLPWWFITAVAILIALIVVVIIIIIKKRRARRRERQLAQEEEEYRRRRDERERYEQEQEQKENILEEKEKRPEEPEKEKRQEKSAKKSKTIVEKSPKKNEKK